MQDGLSVHLPPILCCSLPISLLVPISLRVRKARRGIHAYHCLCACHCACARQGKASTHITACAHVTARAQGKARHPRISLLVHMSLRVRKARQGIHASAHITHLPISLLVCISLRMRKARQGKARHPRIITSVHGPACAQSIDMLRAFQQSPSQACIHCYALIPCKPRRESLCPTTDQRNLNEKT